MEAHIAGHLQDLETADREATAARGMRLKDNRAVAPTDAGVRATEAQVAAAPDGQVSLTTLTPVPWPQAAAARIVGCNVQSAVDAQHHLIVAHDL